VRAAQAKDSTLGPLTKRQRVGAGPVLGRDAEYCLKSETLAVSDGAGPLWPESARKQEKKSEKRKSGREPLH
jgi:hypothetical protein